MARLHTRKRGASKSRKPYSRGAPSWVKLSKQEVESLVEKLAKEGRTPAQIGNALRDLHGVPSAKAVAGKQVTKIMADRKLLGEYPSDLMALIRRAVRLGKHIGRNKKDKSNRQKLAHVEAKIKRLVKYYRGKKLQAGWKYDPATAELLVK